MKIKKGQAKFVKKFIESPQNLIQQIFDSFEYLLKKRKIKTSIKTS